MNRTPVSSRNLKSVGYDPERRILEVEFKDGSVYQYHRVPSTVHRDLLSAASLGSYFAAHIRYSYSYQRIL